MEVVVVAVRAGKVAFKWSMYLSRAGFECGLDGLRRLVGEVEMWVAGE